VGAVPPPAGAAGAQAASTPMHVGAAAGVFACPIAGFPVFCAPNAAGATRCCPAGNICCNASGQCCPAATPTCCPGGSCCGAGVRCCGGACCAAGQSCSPCAIPPPPCCCPAGTFACGDGTCCPVGCVCAPGPPPACNPPAGAGGAGAGGGGAYKNPSSNKVLLQLNLAAQGFATATAFESSGAVNGSVVVFDFASQTLMMSNSLSGFAGNLLPGGDIALEAAGTLIRNTLSVNFELFGGVSNSQSFFTLIDTSTGATISEGTGEQGLSGLGLTITT